VPTIEVRFASGARTDCVIEAGALQRIPKLCAEAGLGGTAGFVCDARVLTLHRDAVSALAALGEPISRPVSEALVDCARRSAAKHTPNATAAKIRNTRCRCLVKGLSHYDENSGYRHPPKAAAADTSSEVLPKRWFAVQLR